MKIRSYLVALILSLFVPLTIFAGAIAYTLAARERAASVDGLRSTARALAIAVDRNIADISNSLGVLATAELLRIRELEGFHRYARRVVDSRPDLQRLTLTERDGTVLFDTGAPFGRAPAEIIGSAEFARAIAIGRPTIGRRDDRGADAASVMVFVPAAIDGIVRYVLVGELNLAVIGSIFIDQKLAPDWTGVVADDDGTILGRSRRPEVFVGRSVPAALATAISRSGEGIVEYQTQEGWPTLAAFARSNASGWTIVLGMPAGSANIAAGRLTAVVVVLGLGVSLIALAVAFFLGHRISNAVLHLLDPALAIARGDSIPAAGTSRISEIQRVMDKLKKASDILADREARRQQAEEQLRRSEGHLARAQSVAEIGSWELTLATGEFYWSEETFRILGVNRTSRAPTLASARTLVVEEDLPLVLQATELASAGLPLPSSSLSLDFRIRRPDGAVRILRREGETVLDPSGKVVTLIGTVQDVTEIRAAEVQRRELQDQLRQTQKMEALGQLTGGIAHDFNNLLAVLIGNLELAVRKQQRGEAATALNEASLRAAGRGAALTRQLLAFARRQPLRPLRHELRQLVEGMVQILEPAMTARIALRFEIAAAPCWVEIDSGQFESALLNLALNARDAMPEGGVLTIRIDAAEDRVAVHVRDTGVGMSAEVRARAFEPFFTTKEVGKGSGLGLSMVYGFVRQSGGRIEIDSAPGQGTAVTLSFARADAPDEEVGAASGPAPVDFRNLRILLVEDDAMVRETVGAMLHDLGATVVAAKDGPTAVGMLKAGEAPDIVLTDIVMPGMDGVAFSRNAVALRPDARMVFMSGHAELDPRTLQAIQEQPFLVKPFRKLQLAAALCEARGPARRPKNPPSASARSVA